MKSVSGKRCWTLRGAVRLAERTGERVVLESEHVDFVDIVRYFSGVGVDLLNCVINCHGWDAAQVGDFLGMSANQVEEACRERP